MRYQEAGEAASEVELGAAVALAERIAVEGDPLLRELDNRSLAWRGKPPKRPTVERSADVHPCRGPRPPACRRGGGELEALCRRHRIRVLTVFGSAARDDQTARDLDVGVLLEPRVSIDYLPLIRDLERLTDTDVDVVHLNEASPVLRERALVGSWCSTAAVRERMDTEWLRRMDLDLLAER